MKVKRNLLWAMGSAAMMVGLAFGASPSVPSYIGVEQSIAKARSVWAPTGKNPQANAPGWEALAGAVEGQLRAYAAAQQPDDQLRALNSLYQISVSLYGVNWAPAVEIRESLRAWLRPRVRLAWAERQLTDRIKSLPPAADSGVAENRQRWLTFVDDELGTALRSYEGAPTTVARQAALKQIHASLRSLQEKNASRAWVPSIALKSALDDLYNRPNLSVTADVHAVSPAFNAYIVNTGPVFWKGQWNYVTAGPKTGFGLLSSDQGIAFYNSQLLTSQTPQISGFQQRLASDPKGKRAAKLYQFAAASADSSQLSIYALLTPNGINLTPAQSHNIGTSVASAPIPGKGGGRFIASLVGFNQNKITRKVKEGADPQIRQGVVSGAAELANLRASQATAERNANLRQHLPGNNTLVYNDFTITDLSLRSRPEYVLVDGKVQMKETPEPLGADSPKPASLSTFQPGVATDVHLASVLANLAGGYFQLPATQNVQNIMIVTKKVEPGAAPGSGVERSTNVAFADFVKAVDATRAANDPKVLAARVKRPDRAAEFSTSPQGHLVVLIHDFQLEVPAPANAAKGGLAGPPAKIYRIVSPEAELEVSFTVAPATAEGPAKFAGRIEGFDAGPQGQVFAIDDDESKAVALNAFTSRIVLNVFAGKLKGQAIDLPLNNLKIPNYTLGAVSPLDPSGWMRVVLTPTR